MTYMEAFLFNVSLFMFLESLPALYPELKALCAPMTKVEGTVTYYYLY